MNAWMNHHHPSRSARTTSFLARKCPIVDPSLGHTQSRYALAVLTFPIEASSSLRQLCLQALPHLECLARSTEHLLKERCGRKRLRACCARCVSLSSRYPPLGLCNNHSTPLGSELTVCMSVWVEWSFTGSGRSVSAR